MPIGLALSCCPASPLYAQDANGDYCEQLTTLVGSTKDDFASFKGELIDEQKWKGAISLNTYKSCYVQQTTTVDYTCESDSFADKAAAVADRNKRFEMAFKCLGRLWQKQETMSEFFVSLRHVDDQSTIIFMAEHEILPEESYIVTARISRTGQQALEPEASIAAPAVPTDFCGTLKDVIKSGKGRFDGLIEGAENNEFKRSKQMTALHWRASKQLPGLEDCYVHEYNNNRDCRYYSCSRGPLSKLAADTFLSSLSSDIQACLGTEWREGKITHSDGTASVQLTGGDDDPTIELRPSKSLYSDAWKASLDVELDVGCK